MKAGKSWLYTAVEGSTCTSKSRPFHNVTGTVSWVAQGSRPPPDPAEPSSLGQPRSLMGPGEGACFTARAAAQRALLSTPHLSPAGSEAPPKDGDTHPVVLQMCHSLLQANLVQSASTTQLQPQSASVTHLWTQSASLTTAEGKLAKGRSEQARSQGN